MLLVKQQAGAANTHAPVAVQHVQQLRLHQPLAQRHGLAVCLDSCRELLATIGLVTCCFGSLYRRAHCCLWCHRSVFFAVRPLPESVLGRSDARGAIYTTNSYKLEPCWQGNVCCVRAGGCSRYLLNVMTGCTAAQPLVMITLWSKHSKR